MMTITATTLRAPRHHRRRVQPRVEHAALRVPHRSTSTRASTTSSLAHSWRGMGKRDMTSNINWFMNVPVERRRHPRHRRRDLRARACPSTCAPRCDVLVVISNCPQINNPCNGFDPTPIRLVDHR